MEVKNEEIKIKIGNKEKVFKNLILNNYLDLFADSFLNFKGKTLKNCLIKFDTIQEIDENSTTMNYDVALETYLIEVDEILTENTVTNKYKYFKEKYNSPKISDFVGRKITEIGFGDYNYNTEEYTIYAYLNVSNYDLIVQEGQEIIISRIDKITTDLKFYSPFSDVNYPVHLTAEGIIVPIGMEYNEIKPKLHSIGFGTLYNKIEKEISIEDLDFKKIGVGQCSITGAKELAIYPSSTLFPSPTLYPRKKRCWIRTARNRK